MRARGSRAAAVSSAVAILGLLVLGAGCDWRDFDAIQSHTPVLAVGGPSHFPTTNDFGRYLLPLSGPPSDSTGGSFVVSAASTAALALVDVDAKGQPHGQTVIAPVFDASAGGVTQPVTTMAEVPGANQVLLGTPDANGGMGATFLMTLGPTPTVAAFAAPATETRFGLGVAAGKLAGADAPELVVASASDLTVYLDGDATMPVVAPANPACPLQVTGAQLGLGSPPNRPVLVASLMTGAAPQIVVGTPGMVGGSVSVFTVDATTGAATCAFSYASTSGGFGQALATGDFNDDGALDLLVGAPPAAAFWIPGPLGPTSQVLPVTLTGATGSALGVSVAALNVDGIAGDEALVGDPDATAGSTVLAGVVRVVGGATLGAEGPVLQRHDPATNEDFGIEVHTLPFCTSACGTPAAVLQNLLLVGADAHAYVFFQPFAGAPDPRTK
jgi:hypothetical protein